MCRFAQQSEGLRGVGSAEPTGGEPLGVDGELRLAAAKADQNVRSGVYGWCANGPGFPQVDANVGGEGDHRIGLTRLARHFDHSAWMLLLKFWLPRADLPAVEK